MVLCASDGKAQTGIDTAMELLRSSVDRFETAATKLASRYAAQESLSKDITRFVQGCKYICTGSYAWRSACPQEVIHRDSELTDLSLNSKRYGLDDAKRDAAGGIVIVI